MFFFFVAGQLAIFHLFLVLCSPSIFFYILNCRFLDTLPSFFLLSRMITSCFDFIFVVMVVDLWLPIFSWGSHCVTSFHPSLCLSIKKFIMSVFLCPFFLSFPHAACVCASHLTGYQIVNLNQANFSLRVLGSSYSVQEYFYNLCRLQL